jgi:hypothetical protein
MPATTAAERAIRTVNGGWKGGKSEKKKGKKKKWRDTAFWHSKRTEYCTVPESG